jgi:L-fucose isomerase-like protein
MERGPRSIKIGLVPITKFVFSRKDALKYKRMIEDRLSVLGVRFVNIDGITGDGTLSHHEELPAVVRHLRDSEVDAIFCPHCNFGTEDVAALLGKEMRLPYLLWGPRDEAPLADGTRLRDTQCGLFATSRILQQMSVPFTYIPNCRLDDLAFDRGVLSFIRVASVCRSMRNMRIGQIGQRVDFFWSVMANEAELLEKFGIQVYQIYMTDLIKQMSALLESPSPDLDETVRGMKSHVVFEHLDEKRVYAIAALKQVMCTMIDMHGLSAVALQCFPALQDTFGIYPCLANSTISSESVPVICETDILGAVGSCLLQAAALNETPPLLR